MRRYETIFIINPDVGEEVREKILDRVKENIEQFKGVLLEPEDWGSRKLAYEIRKKTRGHYYRFDYCGNGDMVDEIERNFRIDDNVLKFLTIVLDKDADPEAIQSEMAQTAAAAEAEAAETAEAAPAGETEVTPADAAEPTQEEEA
ncbi:MAG: 30S ribosomal protein S6 [Deltaproteobacteria bacterium]|nr:MAG: 30S ribosomal protein S6 [Deltaproteobacteria bacterium]